MGLKFDASSPSKITKFTLDVLKDFEVSVTSEWEEEFILTVIKNPKTRSMDEFKTYPNTQCDVRLSTSMILKIGETLKLEKKRQGLYLL